MKRVEGILFFHMETGYEGTPWAIQDKQHIDTTKKVGGWSYEGLNILKTGDVLTIFGENNEVVWNGVIDIDIDFNRRPEFILLGMTIEEQRKFFFDEKSHAIMERYDTNLAEYIYLSSKVFDLRLKGYSDDGPEIEDILDKLDIVWRELDEEEMRIVNEWAAKINIPANE